MSITTQQMKEAKESFSKMISHLGLAAAIEARPERSIIILQVKTRQPGRLIGRNGQSLNAIQHLLNVILLTRKGAFPKVSIDVQGLSDDRSRPSRSSRGGGASTRPASRNDSRADSSDRLRKRAQDAVKEVHRWGEQVVLQAMTPAEIKIVEDVLATESELETVTSNGAGNKITLTIRLKNAK